MDRELEGTLVDLGLSATEAAVYVALMIACETGPVSAYKLAQDMGRDPANLTKVLSSMCQRGAVRASGGRPRLYCPTPAEEFTGRLIARLQERQERALELLRDIGNPPADQDLRVLRSRREATALALGLIAEARRAVLIDATADIFHTLAQALQTAASKQGAMVLALCPEPLELPGVRTCSTGKRLPWLDMAPGPWLRLAVDGRACLEMLAHPSDKDDLLHGHWSRSLTQTFLTHRNLVSEVLLSDLHELLEQGLDGMFASRKSLEQAAALLHQISWRQVWDEAGLPRVALAGIAPETAALPDEGTKQKQADGKEAPPAKADIEPAAAEAAAGEQDDPLQFIFKRPKK